jgi:hypothetical protein
MNRRSGDGEVVVSESDDSAEVHRTPERAILGVIFLLLFVISYSEEIVSALFQIIGYGETEEWRIALIVVDVAILVWVGLLKRSIARDDHGRPRLWRWWWAGCVMVIVLDIILNGLHEYPPAWLDVMSSVLFTIATGILMMSSINADPATLFSSRKRAALRRDWLRARAVVPLIVGILATYIGATVFVDFFDVDVVRAVPPEMAAEVAQLPLKDRLDLLDHLCQNAVNPWFFQHIVEVLPLLLLALGVEFNFFRRTLLDPAQRAATAATVTVIAVGLVFALSTLPWAGTECGEVLAGWHEYIAFIVALQAIFTALATLVWVLVVSTPDDVPVNGDAQAADDSRTDSE